MCLGANPQPFFKCVLGQDSLLACMFPHVKLVGFLILCQLTNWLMIHGEINYPYGKGDLQMPNCTKLLNNVKLLSKELKKSNPPNVFAAYFQSLTQLIKPEVR